MTSSCEDGNEPSGSVRGGKFLDWLSDYELVKKDPVPCSELDVTYT